MVSATKAEIPCYITQQRLPVGFWALMLELNSFLGFFVELGFDGRLISVPPSLTDGSLYLDLRSV